MPRGIGIAILLLEVPLFAGLGNIACIYLVDKYNLKTKTVVIITLLWIGLLIPIWGMIGWATKSGSLPQNLEYCEEKENDYCAELPACDTVVDEGKPGFGIRRGWEIIVLGPLYGFVSGSLFGQMTPSGYESQFFSFYEITDKGSSWMGPLVVTALISSAEKTDDGL
eukprot:gene11710-12210_t